MKLFYHYCRSGFSNCYVLGTDIPEENGSGGAADPRELPRQDSWPREAVIVDPGEMDEQILGFIENNNYNLRGVLITHDHPKHVYGLDTLKRIYRTEIYAVNPIIREHRTNMVRDGDVIVVGSFKFHVISTPGHSSDSAVFLAGRLLFTGDSLSAGLVGRTASAYGAKVQMTALRSKILSLPGDFIILPSHGPPSTLEAERRYNAGIKFYEHKWDHRPRFRIDS
ncbi:MAG: MBL fold metallo-hydrolase [Treponema sp.]|nr:MBL fold metallo-hydrolase [Treponema sp.]